MARGIDADSIAAAVRAAGATDVTSVRGVPTVSGNLVFDVRTRDSTRLAVRFPRNAKAVVREQLISERLRGVVPTPEILLAESTGVSVGRPVQVSRWIEGKRLDLALEACGGTDELKLGEAVGGMLDRLADVELAAPGWLTGASLDVEHREHCLADGVRLHVHERLFGADSGHNIAPRTRQRFWRLVESKVDDLSMMEGDRSLVHGDLIHRNLLVQQDGVAWTVAVVLDWEFALAGPTLRDVGNVMRGAPMPFIAGLEAGLRRKGRALPANWRELAWLLDTVSLTGPLARPSRHPDRLRAEQLIVDAVNTSTE